MSDLEENNYLNDVWCLYFHDPYDMNWETNSYKFITTISSVEDFIEIYKSFNELWSRGMFFIMREHIMPRWEDDNNKNGGCFSFKINKTEVLDKFFEVSSQILGEVLGKTDIISTNINGISICPKKIITLFVFGLKIIIIYLKIIIILQFLLILH